MELAPACHDPNVFPVGNAAAARSVARAGAFPARGFLGEQGPQDLGGFPPLRPGGGDHLGCVTADVRQPQPPQQRLQVAGQRRRRRDTRRRDGRRRGGPGYGTHAVTPPSAAVPSAAQLAVPWASEWSSPARLSGPVPVRER